MSWIPRYCLLAFLLILLGLEVRAQQLPRALRAKPQPAAATASRAHHWRPAAGVQPRQIVRYDWDPATETWVLPLLDRLTYDAVGRPLEVITSDSATATPFQRLAYGYDDRGNLLTLLTQTGNGSPWINESRYLSTYDEHNQLTGQFSQTWTGSSWETTDGFRYQNAYTGPVLTEQVVQVLAAGAYVNTTRFEYTLRDGQWAEALTLRWTGTDWVNEERILDLTWHDWPARQAAGFRVQSWLMSGQWADFQRFGITYAANGTTVQLVEEALPNGSWQNLRRYTSPFDQQGNDLGYRQEEWRAGSWVLTDELRVQLRYDAQNRLMRRTEQRYAPLLAQFVNQQRLNYSDFQDVVTALAGSRVLPGALLLYPVPATEELFLELSSFSQQTTATLEIRSLTGQLLRSTTLLPQPGAFRARVSVRELPAGLYILQLCTPQGTATGHFQRQ